MFAAAGIDPLNAIVIVSVVALFVRAILLPAANVSVSEIESAMIFDCPLTATVLKLFANVSFDVNVIVPVLSLFPDWLEWNRKNIKEYYEIYIDVPISILKERNNKNVYFKDGTENKSVVGVDIEFIRPKNSDLKIINSFDENSLNNNLKLIKEIIKKNE